MRYPPLWCGERGWQDHGFQPPHGDLNPYTTFLSFLDGRHAFAQLGSKTPAPLYAGWHDYSCGNLTYSFSTFKKPSQNECSALTSCSFIAAIGWRIDLMVGVEGLEPATNGLRDHCSTNWATPPYGLRLLARLVLQGDRTLPYQFQNFCSGTLSLSYIYILPNFF